MNSFEVEQARQAARARLLALSREGRRAHDRGETKAGNNPHRNRTLDAMVWEMGWDQGAILEVFEKSEVAGLVPRPDSVPVDELVEFRR